MDKLLNDINGFGRYQKMVLFVIGIMSSLNAMAIFATVFIGADPKLLCKYSKNDTNYIENANEICNVWQNITQSNKLNKSTEYECEWDTKYYGRTIINEWNLVCDRVYLAGLTQTMFMVGALSSFFMGYFSDKYGRKTICLLMSSLMSLSIIINEMLQLNMFGLSNNFNFIVYTICQFFQGFSVNANYYTSFILLLEITSSKHSTLVSNINVYAYVFGELIILLVSYQVKDYHLINYFMCAYSAFDIVLVALILPESPRYLITKKHFKKAYSILRRIAKSNGKSKRLISEREFQDMFLERKQKNISLSTEKSSVSFETDDLINEKIIFDYENDLGEKATQKSSSVSNFTENNGSVYAYLFKSKDNFLKTFFLSYIWMSISMIYYGVSLGITSISTNFDPYLMYLLSSIAEIIGYIFCHLNDKYSRKKVLIFFLGLASLMCLIVAIIPKTNDDNLLFNMISLNSILVILFASIGKAMASAAFNSGYVFTSKLYPTTVRNTLVSLVSSIGRMGSLISPQINLLRILIWDPLPYLIFSFSSLLACLFTMFLPDPSRLNYAI